MAAKFWDDVITKHSSILSGKNDCADLRGLIQQTLSNLKSEREAIISKFSLEAGEDSPSIFKESLEVLDKVEPLMQKKEALKVALSSYIDSHCGEFAPILEITQKVQAAASLKEYLNTLTVIRTRQEQITAFLAKENLEGALDVYTEQNRLEKELNSVACSTHLMKYIKETSRVAFGLIRDSVTKKFEEHLKEMKWPFISLNQTVHQEGFSSDQIQQLKRLSKLLLRVQALIEDEQSKRRSSALTTYILYDFKPLTLLSKILIRPLATRFRYHFCGKRMTNNLDRPEWYFTQVSSWIKDCLPFLKFTYQPIVDDILMDLEQLPPLNLSLEFMSGLVMLVVEKLNGDLPELTQDGQFAHTLDELLIFDRELHSRFDYPVGEAGPLSVLSQAHFFQRMLDMEKRRTAERIDGFFLSPSAWKPLSVAKDEEYRATECGYNFYQVIQIIEERCHSFLQPGHRLQFVEFILDLLDEFRVRLLQVLKTERDQPLSETAVGILNSTDFFLSMMENWNDLPFYVQMMFFRKQVHGTSESDNEAKEELLEGLFDAQITLYKHVRDDLLSSLVRRVVGELKHQSKSYLSDKWFSMLPHSPLIPASLTASAVGMFACLQNHLCDLNKRLNPSLFKSALRSISSLIEEHLLNDLILDNHFNDGGAAQLKFDVEKNLIPIFGEYSEVPDRGFRQLKEAINLLNLPFGSATLLQDALENPESKATDIDLEEFGVKRLKHHVVSKVLRSRLSLHKVPRRNTVVVD